MLYNKTMAKSDESSSEDSIDDSKKKESKKKESKKKESKKKESKKKEFKKKESNNEDSSDDDSNKKSKKSSKKKKSKKKSSKKKESKKKSSRVKKYKKESSDEESGDEESSDEDSNDDNSNKKSKKSSKKKESKKSSKVKKSKKESSDKDSSEDDSHKKSKKKSSEKHSSKKDLSDNVKIDMNKSNNFIPINQMSKYNGLSSSHHMIPMIYNENNILITAKDVENIINRYLSKKNKIKVDENNLNLYIIAFTHKSYTKGAYIIDENAVMNPTLSFVAKKKKYIINVPFESIKNNNAMPLRNKSYERLEFLGDSVIHYILGNYIFHRFVEDDEGLMTKVRTKLENSGKMCVLSKTLKLGQFILLAKQIEVMKGRDKIISILEDVFESFVGAMHEEFGMEVCREFVINVIEDTIDITDLLENDDNYKDQLLRYYHIMKWPHPKYEKVSETINESDNSRVFKVTVKNNDRVIGYGMGGSLKKAEQMSAKMALEYLSEHVQKIDLTRNTKDV